MQERRSNFCWEVFINLGSVALFVGSIFGLIYTYEFRFFISLLILSYFLMIGEAFACKTYKFMSNIMAGGLIFNEIETLKTKKPIVKFSIQNYHRSGGGNAIDFIFSRRYRSSRRVNTHSAEEDFRY